MLEQKNNIIEQVKYLLSSMEDVYYVKKNEKLILKKNEITFGEIENDAVSLVNKNSEFVQISKATLETIDQFLREATESYYTAVAQSSLKKRWGMRN